MKYAWMSVLSLLALPAFAAEPNYLAPWIEPGDVPIAAAVKSLRVRVRESALYQRPGAMNERRGTVLRDGVLPLFAAQRGEHCRGRWLLVGPSAWLCSDEIEYLATPYAAPRVPPSLSTGLPFDYYFVPGDGASAYGSLDAAAEGVPEGDLERGFYLPIVQIEERDGLRWGRTRRGQYIAMRELAKARPLDFEGEKLADGKLEIAWVRVASTTLWSAAKSGKKLATLPRFSKVVVTEEPVAKASSVAVRSESGEGYIKLADLSRPTQSAPPDEARADERWIDIDIASQTLVAYEGSKPVMATLVSTGKGPQGSELATPKGTYRIWVKLRTTNMDNLEKEFAEDHYSIEDVPYVQFFHRGVALHAAFWHRDFGHVHSHGCVNLVPEDARFLFSWTGPHVPAGWDAVLPSVHEPGTLIRVR